MSRDYREFAGSCDISIARASHGQAERVSNAGEAESRVGTFTQLTRYKEEIGRCSPAWCLTVRVRPCGTPAFAISSTTSDVKDELCHPTTVCSLDPQTVICDRLHVVLKSMARFIKRFALSSCCEPSIFKHH